MGEGVAQEEATAPVASRRAGAGYGPGMGKAFSIAKSVVMDFLDDQAMTWAAAIAFYSSLSFGPLLVLLLWGASLLGDDLQARLMGQFEGLIGEEAMPAVREVMVNAEESPARGFAAIISLGVLLFSASGVFAQLQAALNAVFDVKAAPTKSTTAGIWAYVRRRLLSMGMIATLLFILVVSLVATTFLQTTAGAVGLEAGEESMVGPLISLATNMLVFTGLFTVMFKLLPDVTILWKPAVVGAVATAVLFALGKFGIGVYLANSSVGSSYGAAGSIIVLLVWVYYSAIIVMLGAEITQAIAFGLGMPVEPDEHAVWADDEALAGGKPKRARGEAAAADSASVDSAPRGGRAQAGVDGVGQDDV